MRSLTSGCKDVCITLAQTLHSHVLYKKPNNFPDPYPSIRFNIVRYKFPECKHRDNKTDTFYYIVFLLDDEDWLGKGSQVSLRLSYFSLWNQNNKQRQAKGTVDQGKSKATNETDL